MKSTKTFSFLAALAGLLGTVLLGIYFGVPFPLPPATASVSQITAVTNQYHDDIFLDTWLQAAGTLLIVLFSLALVHLAKAMLRLSGWITLLAASTILGTALLEGTFALGSVMATADGQTQAALTSFVLTFVFGHVFLIVPAPLLFFAIGASLYKSTVLPSIFIYLAFVLGAAFALLGFAGLFNDTAQTIVTYLQIGQELWFVAAAIVLLIKAVRLPNLQQA